MFFPLCLVALASLLYSPLIGAGQSSDRNRTFVFHGHRVNAAFPMDAARWANPDERQGPIKPQPVPIPGGILAPPLIHVFAPGPIDQGDQGIDVEPNVITNFRGFTAMGYPVGTAQDSNGNTYNLVTDMRVFRGEYITADGVHHRGTFVFIWIDLFDPSSGSQVHDFNGAIQPSGLFWIVQAPEEALKIDDDGVKLDVDAASVIDDFQFLAPASVPGTVHFHMTWKADGAVQHFTPQSSDPTDPTNFVGDFRPAIATGTFSGSELGFSFTATGSSDTTFAEFGTERNGVFLQSK
jgi:hypothetical protein